MDFIDLGLIEYSKALALQHQCVEHQTEKVFICEHPLTITLGRALDAASDILSDSKSQVPVFSIERGGRATLHLPGQVVVYPIVNLKKRGLDQVQWLRAIETMLLELLQDFRIQGVVIPGKTGVWVGEKKIASIGTAVKNDMSFHGLALNVSCDLSQFKLIKPCGFDANIMTSMGEALRSDYEKVWRISQESLLGQVRLRFREILEEQLWHEACKK